MFNDVIIELQNNGLDEKSAKIILIKYYKPIKFDSNAADFANAIVSLDQARLVGVGLINRSNFISVTDCGQYEMIGDGIALNLVLVNICIKGVFCTYVCK